MVTFAIFYSTPLSENFFLSSWFDSVKVYHSENFNFQRHLFNTISLGCILKNVHQAQFCHPVVFVWMSCSINILLWSLYTAIFNSTIEYFKKLFQLQRELSVWMIADLMNGRLYFICIKDE